MLRLAAIFFVIAIIAAVFGFGVIVGSTMALAKIFFYIFIVLFLVSLIVGFLSGGRRSHR